MKILIYGHNGWIGKQFCDILDKQNVSYVCGVSRADNDESLGKEIHDTSPTHVISFIGRTHGKIDDKVYSTIDYLEQDGKLLDNIRDNLYSPLILAIICQRKNIHFTYLGTGCIFEYDEHHPYGKELNGFTETSMPNFFGSSYSIVKGFTDRLMHQYEDNVLNLRIRMPINSQNNSRNFITKITNYEKICNVPNSMSVLPDLLPLVIDLMKRNHTGSLNLTNPGLISHNEILEMYREIVDPNFTWNNFTIEEQNKILASKRSNNFLETAKLEKLCPSVCHIKVAVRKCLEGYNKNN